MPEHHHVTLDQEKTRLLARLHNFVAPLRAHAVRNMNLIMDAVEQRTGGVAVIQAPCKAKGRDLSEVAYQTEDFRKMIN